MYVRFVQCSVGTTHDISRQSNYSGRKADTSSHRHGGTSTRYNVNIRALSIISKTFIVRRSWKLYVKEAQAVIFVVDASDEIRFPIVKEELHVSKVSHQFSFSISK